MYDNVRAYNSFNIDYAWQHTRFKYKKELLVIFLQQPNSLKWILTLLYAVVFKSNSMNR